MVLEENTEAPSIWHERPEPVRMTQEIRDFNYRERMRSRREAEQGPRVALEPDPNVDLWTDDPVFRIIHQCFMDAEKLRNGRLHCAHLGGLVRNNPEAWAVVEEWGNNNPKRRGVMKYVKARMEQCGRELLHFDKAGDTVGMLDNFLPWAWAPNKPAPKKDDAESEEKTERTVVL